MKIDTILIVALGGLGYYLYSRSKAPAGPTYFGPGFGPETTTAAPTQTRATVKATTAAPAVSKATTVPYAPMINAPAYAPEGWAPPTF